MNVSNSNNNGYETKLTVVENKLRSLSGNQKLSEEEKAKETSELKAEKKQLQRKIDAKEEKDKREELMDMMTADDAKNQLSTINNARNNLISGIEIKTAQKELDIARGSDGKDAEEDIDKLNDKLDNFTDNFLKQMSKDEDKKKKTIFSDEEEKGQQEKLYKGTNYRKELDIHI